MFHFFALSTVSGHLQLREYVMLQCKENEKDGDICVAAAGFVFLAPQIPKEKTTSFFWARRAFGKGKTLNNMVLSVKQTFILYLMHHLGNMFRLTIESSSGPYIKIQILIHSRRLRWSSSEHADLWHPSLRFQTRPKPLDFYGRKNPQHAFHRRGSKRICPMSQLCGI